jgi:nitroreductase
MHYITNKGEIVDTLETIKSRRSIRKYKTDAVDEKALETILDAARLAPSWANTQCWKFIVIRDSGMKAKLAETLVVNPRLGNNPALNAIVTAPVVIVVCAEKRVSGCYQGNPLTDKGDAWYMFDIGLAMENLVLAAASLGLGTVHVGLFEAEKVTSLLEIPENYSVVEMTPLGYPEFQPNARPRKALEEIVFHEKFGQK